MSNLRNSALCGAPLLSATRRSATQRFSDPGQSDAYNRHLARIIETCERADMAADIVGIGVISFTINMKDGTSVINSNTFAYTKRYRAEKAARKTVHVAHSFWLTGMGLFFGRWA